MRQAPRFERFFLHRRPAAVRPLADRRQCAGRRHDAASGPDRRLSGPRRRTARIGLFRRHAGRDAGCADHHPARRPHPRLRRLRGARHRQRHSDAGHCRARGLAPVPGADRLRLRRPLCGHRSLDQRQGDQFEPRQALRALSDRQFRRLRLGADGDAAAGSGRLCAVRGRRRRCSPSPSCRWR